MPHPFVFKVRKAIEAAGVLLRSTRSRRMNYMRLLKLLYIADRESLRDTGQPITGDRAVAMERGPVLNGVYSIIKEQHMGVPQWNRFFRLEAWDLLLARETGVGELSPYEIEKLEEIARRYEDKDEWDMVQLTHDLPEWIKNKPQDRSSRPIPLEDILAAVGRSQDAESIIQEEKDRETFDRIFNTPPVKKAPEVSS